MSIESEIMFHVGRALHFSRVTFMSKNDTTYKICLLVGLQRQSPAADLVAVFIEVK